MRVFVVKKGIEIITVTLIESDAIKICSNNKGYLYQQIDVYDNPYLKVHITNNEPFKK